MALRRHMKNFVKNYSEAEIKVREATSNDPWGPSSSLMLEISDLTYNRVSFSEIMSMIWHRMNDHGKNWRHVYKSLTLLDYLLKNGSKKVIQHCQEGSYNIKMLKDFRHIDEAGKDQGFYVREKSKQVIALLTDEHLLHNEREIAHRTRQRTSYATLFPPKTSGKTCSSAIPASDSTSEFPPSENVPSHGGAPSGHRREAKPASQGCAANGNTETSVRTPMPASVQVVVVQVARTPAPVARMLARALDLIVFSEDEPSTFVMQSTFPTRVSKDEPATDKKTATSNPRKAKTALSPSERLPAPKWGSSKKSKSSAVSRVLLKVPPKEETSVHKVTKILFDLWSSPPEEFITINKQVSKPDVIRCSSEPSVETIYRSPILQAFHPSRNSAENTTKSTPASSTQSCGPYMSSLQNLDFSVQGTAQTAGLNSHPSPRPDLKERIAHSFSQASDVDENETTSTLSLLPGNSKCSVKKVSSFRSRTCHSSGGSLVKSLMHNIPSVPNPGLPAAENLPNADYVNSEQKGMAILGEIKNEVCGLRADFCSAAQDLQIIRRELTTMTISMQKMTAPQTAQGASGQK
uniref:ENTH domain-containing protein 1 n=1 Tax=Euleptes europaea TaxID=460621 RepID=UPI00254093AF|nr:ENTH domain-containing protein 1 [Euleptes europaea]